MELGEVSCCFRKCVGEDEMVKIQFSVERRGGEGMKVVISVCLGERETFEW